jgi:hypothetical protein
MRVPVIGLIHCVTLSQERAAELRKRVGTEQMAGQIECESVFPPWPDAKLLRVEPDEPVAVFVDASWPYGVPD